MTDPQHSKAAMDDMRDPEVASALRAEQAQQPATALTSKSKVCPRAKSDFTPCYIKDGHLAVAIASVGWGAGQREICVGCEFGIGLLREERTLAVTRPKLNPTDNIEDGA